MNNHLNDRDKKICYFNFALEKLDGTEIDVNIPNKVFNSIIELTESLNCQLGGGFSFAYNKLQKWFKNNLVKDAIIDFKMYPLSFELFCGNENSEEHKNIILNIITKNCLFLNDIIMYIQVHDQAMIEIKHEDIVSVELLNKFINYFTIYPAEQNGDESILIIDSINKNWIIEISHSRDEKYTKVIYHGKFAHNI